MADVEAFGDEDESVAAIQAILDGASSGAAPEGSDDDDNEGELTAKIEATIAAPEENQNPGEEAPEGDKPAEQPEEGEVKEAKQAEPEPAKPAPKVEPPAQTQQPQTNDLSTLANGIAAVRIQIAAEFSDIKTMDDLAKLAAEEPARYVRFDFLTKKLQQDQGTYAAAVNAQHFSWRQAEAQSLRAHPDFSDPLKGPELEQKVIKYAMEERGYTREDISRASARDMIMAYDAMRVRDLEAKLKAKDAEIAKAIASAKDKAKDAPKVQKPGAAAPTVNKAEEKDKELVERFQKSGRDEDGIALFMHRGY